MTCSNCKTQTDEDYDGLCSNCAKKCDACLGYSASVTNYINWDFNCQKPIWNFISVPVRLCTNCAKSHFAHKLK